MEPDHAPDMAELCCDASQSGTLQHLSLHLCGINLKDGYCLGWLKLFNKCIPTIRTLSIQFNRYVPTEFFVWGHMLTRFPNLEALFGKEDGGFLTSFKVQYHHAIHELSLLCPELVSVDGMMVPKSSSPEVGQVANEEIG